MLALALCVFVLGSIVLGVLLGVIASHELKRAARGLVYRRLVTVHYAVTVGVRVYHDDADEPASERTLSRVADHAAYQATFPVVGCLVGHESDVDGRRVGMTGNGHARTRIASAEVLVVARD